MGLPEDYVLTGTWDQKAERICRMVPPQLIKAVAETLFEKVIRQYKEKNKYVIIASRHLENAENICDRVCFLDRGRLVLNTSIQEIRARTKDNVFRLECDGDISFLKLIKEVQIKEEKKNMYKVTIKDKSFDRGKLITVLNKNIRIIKFEQYRPDLNDIYSGLIKTIQRRKPG